jgi:hypothetical protein
MMPSLRRPEGRNMFTRIRKYSVRRGSAEELARRVREGFVPLMRQMHGFRGAQGKFPKVLNYVSHRPRSGISGSGVQAKQTLHQHQSHGDNLL